MHRNPSDEASEPKEDLIRLTAEHGIDVAFFSDPDRQSLAKDEPA
jgi:hypothetical protein